MTNLFVVILARTDSTKCQLQCFADVGPRQFVKFNFGNVEDGTVCDEFDENTGVCLAGKCTVKGTERERERERRGTGEGENESGKRGDKNEIP